MNHVMCCSKRHCQPNLLTSFGKFLCLYSPVRVYYAVALQAGFITLLGTGVTPAPTHSTAIYQPLVLSAPVLIKVALMYCTVMQVSQS